MAEEQVPGPSGGASVDGPWLTVAAAARQMGISPRAIRGRIRGGTIEWKAQGNAGKLVRVPSGDVSPDNPGDGSEDELDQLHEERTEAPIAAARAEERATAQRELCDRLTSELAEARKPWWRRWRG